MDALLSLVYERVYLPLDKVSDTPFHIQGDVNISHRRIILTYNQLHLSRHRNHHHRHIEINRKYTDRWHIQIDHHDSHLEI